MRVASKVGNLPSKCGQLGLWVLWLFATGYVLDGQTDGQTDKSNAYSPPSYGRGHNSQICKMPYMKLLRHLRKNQLARFLKKVLKSNISQYIYSKQGAERKKGRCLLKPDLQLHNEMVIGECVLHCDVMYLGKLNNDVALTLSLPIFWLPVPGKHIVTFMSEVKSE